MFYFLTTLISITIISKNLNCIAVPLIGETVKNADIRGFPSVVAIGLRDIANCAEVNHVCTGVLISKKHILTAAHCFNGILLDDIQIILATSNLRTGVRLYPSMWITFDQWAQKNNKTIEFDINDIAVIKLNEKATKIRGVKPAKLSKVENNKLWNTKATIAGWGVSELNRTIPSRKLKMAKVTVQPPSICEQAMKNIALQNMILSERYLCTMARPYVLTGCGDSGGPLLDDKNRVLAINRGICPKNIRPEIPEEVVHDNRINLHTGVDYYREFINDVLNSI